MFRTTHSAIWKDKKDRQTDMRVGKVRNIIRTSFRILLSRCRGKNNGFHKNIYEPARIRTWNLLIRSQARYPLRHRPSERRTNFLLKSCDMIWSFSCSYWQGTGEYAGYFNITNNNDNNNLFKLFRNMTTEHCGTPLLEPVASLWFTRHGSS